MNQTLLSDADKNTRKKELAAKRQAAYRERKSGLLAGEKNLNLYINYDAANALARLCKHHSVTHKEMIAKLLCDADKKLADQLKKKDTELYLKYTELEYK